MRVHVMPKRYGKARTTYNKTLARLTENDRNELAKFGEFLRDGASMPWSDVLKKYGTYLGDWNKQC